MGVLYSPSDLSLDDLIATAQVNPRDDTEAMAEILRRFEKEIDRIARVLAWDWSDQQDAAQGARMGLVKAVRLHTHGTQGFASYARQYMLGAARRTRNEMTCKEISKDPTDLIGLGNDLGGAPEPQSFNVHWLCARLTSDQRSVVVARYVNDQRVADIATDLGISTSAASQRLKTIHRILRPLVEQAAAA